MNDVNGLKLKETRYINPKISVQCSGIQGYGLFANEPIEQGEWVWRDDDYKKTDNPNLYDKERLKTLTESQMLHQVWDMENTLNPVVTNTQY